MAKLSKTELIVLQDLTLIVIGVFLLSLSLLNVLGDAGFLTLLLGSGFILFSTIDFFRLMRKLQFAL